MRFRQDTKYRVLSDNWDECKSMKDTENKTYCRELTDRWDKNLRVGSIQKARHKSEMNQRV